MYIEQIDLTPTELAAFDATNFDEELAMTEDEWIKVLATGIVKIWVARDDSTSDCEIVGICVLKTAKDINLWYCFSIAVAKQYRGQGMAKKLYRAAIENEIPFGKIQAHCEIDNIASIHLHQALGFKSTQYVNDFYGEYNDAILWERER